MAERNDVDGRSLVTTRIFDVPRELVFEAWTHPNHLLHWWGPLGFSITTKSFDFRSGGVWRFVMHGPDGREYQNCIVFDEIAPPERLRFHHEPADEVDRVSHSTLVTFEDEGGCTKLTMHLLFASADERARVIREYGAEEGLAQTVERLWDYVSAWRGKRGLEKSIVVMRDFDAPRDLVFRAFTEAEHLAKWWGPRGFTNPVCRIDANPGGAIFIEMRGPDGSSHPMTGTVHEIVPDERFVFTAVARDAADRVLLESHTTVTFKDKGRGTQVRVEARAKGLAEVARLMLAGMEAGWAQSLDKLAECVAPQTA